MTYHVEEICFQDNYPLGNFALSRGLFVNFDSAPGMGDTILNSMYADALLHTFPNLQLDVIVQHPLFYYGKKLHIIDESTLAKKGRFEHGRKLLDKEKLTAFLQEKQYPFIFSIDFFLEDCVPQETPVSIFPLFSDRDFYPFGLRRAGKEYRIAINEQNLYAARKSFARKFGLTSPAHSPSIKLTPPSPVYQPPQHTLLVNPHASYPVKEWEIASWATIIEHLQSNLQEYTFLLSAGETPRHNQHQKEIKNKCSADIQVLPPLHLTAFLNVLRTTTACISVDTGTVHMAHALNVPSIVLYVHQYNSAWTPPTAHMIEIGRNSTTIEHIVLQVQEIVGKANFK